MGLDKHWPDVAVIMLWILRFGLFTTHIPGGVLCGGNPNLRRNTYHCPSKDDILENAIICTATVIQEIFIVMSFSLLYKKTYNFIIVFRP